MPQKRAESIEVRLESDEKKGFQMAAELSGMTLSAWVRDRLRRAAIRELEQASRDIPFLRRPEID